jgi:hypothetical protein
MERTYKIYNLILKYTPAIIKLFGDSFDWSIEDLKYEKKLDIRQKYRQRNKTDEMQINTSFYDLLLEAELKDKFSINFAYFINNLLVDLVLYLPDFENKFKDNFDGKINNLDNWNYLNPIGELACLKKLLDSQIYILKEIECSFENGSSKDFLLHNKNTNLDTMVEVLNIHSKFEDGKDFETIKNDLFQKIDLKVKKETANVDPIKYKNSLFFLPVIWHIKQESMERYYDFFKDFKNNLGKELGLNYAICGLQSYLIINDKFEFGEISSLIDRIKHVA